MRQYLPVLRRVPLFAGLEEEQLMEAWSAWPPV